MSDVAVRDLRNHTRQILDRVRSGEAIVITVDGRPTAELRPLSFRPRFTDRQTFVARVIKHQADHGLGHDLAELAPDSTDDLPW